MTYVSFKLFVQRNYPIRRNFRKKNLLNCLFPSFDETPRNGERHSLQPRCPARAGRTTIYVPDRNLNIFKPNISQCILIFPNIFPIFSKHFLIFSKNFPMFPKQPTRMVPPRLPTGGPHLQWKVEKANHSIFFQVFIISHFYFIFRFPCFRFTSRFFSLSSIWIRCKLNFFFPDVDSKRVDELVKKIRFNRFF